MKELYATLIRMLGFLVGPASRAGFGLSGHALIRYVGFTGAIALLLAEVLLCASVTLVFLSILGNEL